MPDQFSRVPQAGCWSLTQTGTLGLILLSLVACGSGSPTSTDSDGNARAGAQAGGAAGGGGRHDSAGNSARGGASGSAGATGVGGGLGGAGRSGSGGSGSARLCNGFPPPSGPSGQSCRSQADCMGGAQCRESPPTGAGLCGACFATPHECSLDADCGVGKVCLTESPTPPCQCMGPGTYCAPSCTADSCLPDDVCGADGHCAPKSCQDGYQCLAGTVCDPARARSGHGCAVARCDLGEMTCPDGGICDPASAPASLNHCRGVRCSEGATCLSNYRCNSNTDSCQRLVCTNDSDCDCGVCIDATCQDHAFMCFSAPP